MPFVKIKVNRPITREQEIELKCRMGKAIELILGKSEDYLLLEFEHNCRIWLRGNNVEPVAYIEAAILGNESHLRYSDFSAEVTKIYKDVLGIAPENCYIKFDDIIAWSVGEQYISPRRFL